jgi:hypothetical protein
MLSVSEFCDSFATWVSHPPRPMLMGCPVCVGPRLCCAAPKYLSPGFSFTQEILINLRIRGQDIKVKIAVRPRALRMLQSPGNQGPSHIRQFQETPVCSEPGKPVAQRIPMELDFLSSSSVDRSFWWFAFMKIQLLLLLSIS